VSVRRKYVLFAALAFVSAALDQASKVWVRDHLPSFGRGGMSVFGRRLVLVYAENPGIAFSQLQEIRGGRILLSLVLLVALALIARFVRKTPASRPWTVAALGLICGGALGNVIDRLSRGSVTDFVLADLGVWPFHPWPVFNVADAALVAGVAILALALTYAKGWPPPA
jgi:signal peptidase II